MAHKVYSRKDILFDDFKYTRKDFQRRNQVDSSLFVFRLAAGAGSIESPTKAGVCGWAVNEIGRMIDFQFWL